MKKKFIFIIFTVFIFCFQLLFNSFCLGAEVAPSDDKYSGYQSYLRQSEITSVWNKYTGKDVIVAVIDSGVDLNHEDLKGNLWLNNKEILNNNFDDDSNGYVDDYYGYNFLADNADMSPYNSHGTMVSGIIVAKRNNYIGVAGIAPDAKVMPLTVCSSKGCPMSAIIKAIRYAVDNGANIINMSLGGDGSLGYDPNYNDAIKYAYEHNVLVVAAAGNGDTEGNGTRGQDLSNMKASPVCNDQDINMVLGVGALDSYNKPTQWTNYSKDYVDISAPGVDIVSTSVPLYTKDSFSYGVMDGTSFSAPIVSGVAAILKEKHPDWKNYELMSQIISRSDTSADIGSNYGAILNAKSIINLNNPKAELKSATPSVSGGIQNIIRITGKNFYDSMGLSFSSDSFSGKVPLSVMKVANNQIVIDINKWESIKFNPGKYKIYTDAYDGQNSVLPEFVEVKNVVNLNQTLSGASIAPASPTINKATSSPVNIVAKKYAIFSKIYNIRQSANITSKILMTTKKNIKYEVLDLSKKDWIKIKVDNKNIGWVLKKLVKVL